LQGKCRFDGLMSPRLKSTGTRLQREAAPAGAHDQLRSYHPISSRSALRNKESDEGIGDVVELAHPAASIRSRMPVTAHDSKYEHEERKELQHVYPARNLLPHHRHNNKRGRTCSLPPSTKPARSRYSPESLPLGVLLFCSASSYRCSFRAPGRYARRENVRRVSKTPIRRGTGELLLAGRGKGRGGGNEAGWNHRAWCRKGSGLYNNLEVGDSCPQPSTILAT
jgi:hypothetical protein